MVLQKKTTNPPTLGHNPVKEAADLCIDLLDCNKIVKINPTSVAPIEVFKLAKSLNLSRAEVFDCNLAVTAKENGIDAIYTENVNDFKCYPFVKTKSF